MCRSRGPQGGSAAEPVGEHHELVAAEPGDRVAVPETVSQALGHLDQDRFPRAVSEAVVDRLEAVGGVRDDGVAQRHPHVCAVPAAEEAAKGMVGPENPAVLVAAHLGDGLPPGSYLEGMPEGLLTGAQLGGVGRRRVGGRLGPGPRGVPGHFVVVAPGVVHWKKNGSEHRAGADVRRTRRTAHRRPSS